MATVTGFTATRMLQIENESIVDGNVVGDELILETREGTLINAGNVRGPIGSPGVTEAEFAAQTANNTPVGTIVDYIGTVAPARWLVMQGQTIANGQTLYPTLWGLLPASMKSGSSIIMPDTRGRVTVGLNTSDVLFDVVGDTGGQKDQVVVTHSHAGPSHTHTGPSHAHYYGSTTGNAGDHVHGMTHGHTGAVQDAYGMPGNVAYEVLRLSSGGTSAVALTGGGQIVGLDNIRNGTYHNHGLTINNFSGNTASGGTHAHSVAGWTNADGTQATGASGTQPTSTVGESGASKNLQPFITFQKIIKVE